MVGKGIARVVGLTVLGVGLLACDGGRRDALAPGPPAPKELACMDCAREFFSSDDRDIRHPSKVPMPDFDRAWLWKSMEDCQELAPSVSTPDHMLPRADQFAQQACRDGSGRRFGSAGFVCIDPKCSRLETMLDESSMFCSCKKPRRDKKGRALYVCSYSALCCCEPPIVERGGATRPDTPPARTPRRRKVRSGALTPPTSGCTYVGPVLGGWNCYQGRWTMITLHHWKCPDGPKITIEIHTRTPEPCPGNLLDGFPRQKLTPATTP